MALLLPAESAGQRARAVGPRPGSGLERLNRIPPAAREDRLRQSPAFQKLPPEKQQAAINSLRRLNALPPDQQKKIVQRLRAFSRLDARQREGLRDVYKDYQAMPPGDRGAFRSAYHQLRALSPADREKQLNSDAVQQRLTPGEIATLRQALSLNLPDELVGRQP
jgi:hypothetical protein